MAPDHFLHDDTTTTIIMSGSHRNPETRFSLGAQLGQRWWEQVRKSVVVGRSKKGPMPPQTPMETSRVSPSLLGLSFPYLYPGVSRFQVFLVVDSRRALSGDGDGVSCPDSTISKAV